MIIWITYKKLYKLTNKLISSNKRLIWCLINRMILMDWKLSHLRIKWGCLRLNKLKKYLVNIWTNSSMVSKLMHNNPGNKTNSNNNISNSLDNRLIHKCNNNSKVIIWIMDYHNKTHSKDFLNIQISNRNIHNQTIRFNNNLTNSSTNK